ncbi:MAG: hypothetical protein R3D98_01080 [Candidatus Krumholzibacteriia bacterium]
MGRHRLALVVLLGSVLATVAVAQAPGPSPPPIRKPAGSGAPPPPDPAVIRQGGDTIADAVDLPFVYPVTGTTVGYTNDYDEVCPYPDSVAPDVVYRLFSTWGTNLDIDMFGSTYDTKIYLYDQDLELVACNDDFYPDYVSRLEAVPIHPGQDYFLVIDGYGAEAGDYVVTVETAGHWCEVFWEPWWQFEEEPPLADGYVDAFNSGCSGDDVGYPFTVLGGATDFYGLSGWYDRDGEHLRDTDWFSHHLGPDGTRVLTVEVEYDSVVWLLWPQDCGGELEWLERVELAWCDPVDLVVSGDPGQEVWVVIAPADWFGAGEYAYTIGLEPHDTVASERHSWSAVKELFR